MTTLDQNNYLRRQGQRDSNGKRNFYDWFPVRHVTSGNKGMIDLGTLILPREYLGRRVRIRLVVEEVDFFEE